MCLLHTFFNLSVTVYMYHTCKHLIVETIYILDDQVNNDDVDEDDGDDDENVKGVKALFFETVTPGGLQSRTNTAANNSNQDGLKSYDDRDDDDDNDDCDNDDDNLYLDNDKAPSP